MMCPHSTPPGFALKYIGGSDAKAGEQGAFRRMFCNAAVAADLAQVSSPSAGAIHMSVLHRSGRDARGAGGPMNRVAGEDRHNERYVCSRNEGDPLRDPPACRCDRQFP